MSDMVSRVAKAIHGSMDVADGLDTTVAEKYARAAIAAMRPTNDQIKAAVADWLNETEGFALRAERVPPDALSWLYHAAYVGAGAAFPPESMKGE